MRRHLGVVLALCSVLYPFAVYFGLGHVQPGLLAVPIAAVWLARSLAQPSGHAPGGRWLPLAALAFCAALALMNSGDALRWYPVMINALLFAAFARSLSHGRPLIERLARLRHPELPAAAVRHTRRVTQVWCGFFLANGMTAGALAAWGSWDAWTWYNGAASYALMGLLLGGEWLLRPRAARV